MAAALNDPDTKIVVVEDQSIVARDLAARLTALGYNVVATVGSGRQAIEIILKDKPDLVLMDIVLKDDMDGIETAEAIRARMDIPIVFITAHVDQEKLERAKNTRPFGYLVKPVQDLDLKIAVEMALNVARVEAQTRLVEEDLRRERDRTKRYLDMTGVVILVLNRVGEIELINPAGFRLLGYREEELLGKSWFETCLPERYRSEVQAVFQKLKNGEIELPEYHENPVLTKSGEERIISWHNGVLTDEDGRFTGTISSGQDITEQKRSDQALRDSYETLVTVLDSVKADIHAADIETHEILFMNRNMIETFGRDLVGKKCYQAFRGENKPCRHCNNDRLLDAEKRPSGVIMWDDRNPVTGRWYMNYDQAVPWLDGRFVRMQIAMDITELKQAEGERQRLEAQLRQSQRIEAIGTLAGGIAHDFNNILGAITGFTELSLFDLEENQMPDPVNLRQVLKAADRARELIKHILTFSRETEREFSPVEVSIILKESLAFLRSSLPTTIEIRRNIETENSRILADPTQIHQVIMNLGANAGQAMIQNGGVLEATLAELSIESVDAEPMEIEPGRYLRLTISDTGHGMDRPVLERIFEPYFTTKEPGEGTGLGLAVVHGAVKQHGGAIKVYSEPGKGTVFHVFLPLVPSLAPEDGLPESVTIPGGSESILFVDDEATLAELGQSLLVRLGYRVTSRVSSLEALELFRRNPYEFDLVITDQTMPNMTGLELAKKIILLRPDIPIILCTGFSRQATYEQTDEIGIKKILMKPLILKNMAESVREVLDQTKH